MEVFAVCFPEPFRTSIYPAVEDMQEILGRANDFQVATGRLGALCRWLRAAQPGDWRRYRPGIEGLLRHHRQQLPRERKRFLAWWTHWKNAGTESLFVKMLDGAGGLERNDR
jgi:hypothetical protein